MVGIRNHVPGPVDPGGEQQDTVGTAPDTAAAKAQAEAKAQTAKVALSVDEAKARLAARWAAALQRPQSSSLGRESVRGYLRCNPGRADGRDGQRGGDGHVHVQTVVDVYTRGLVSVADDWLRSELPQPAIEGLLEEQNAVCKKPAPPAPPARAGKAAARGQTVTRTAGPGLPSTASPDTTAATVFVDNLDGATFSTLLLLIYVPGASVLKSEARARQSKQDTERTERIEEMLKRHGFGPSPMQQVVRFAQLFTPQLIAPLGAEIVGLFGD